MALKPEVRLKVCLGKRETGQQQKKTWKEWMFKLHNACILVRKGTNFSIITLRLHLTELLSINYDIKYLMIHEEIYQTVTIK